MASWFLVPALKVLIAEANAIAPNRSKASDGTIGDADHRSRASDHNPEADGSVDAVDLTDDPAHGFSCEWAFQQIIARRDRRVKYMIFRSRIVSGDFGPSPWVIRRHNGNPHDHHLHVSVLDATQNDTSPWLTWPFNEEAELNQQEAQQLKETRARVDQILDLLKPDTGGIKAFSADTIARLIRIEEEIAEIKAKLDG